MWERRVAEASRLGGQPEQHPHRLQATPAWSSHGLLHVFGSMWWSGCRVSAPPRVLEDEEEDGDDGGERNATDHASPQRHPRATPGPALPGDVPAFRVCSPWSTRRANQANKQGQAHARKQHHHRFKLRRSREEDRRLHPAKGLQGHDHTPTRPSLSQTASVCSCQAAGPVHWVYVWYVVCANRVEVLWPLTEATDALVAVRRSRMLACCPQGSALTQTPLPTRAHNNRLASARQRGVFVSPAQGPRAQQSETQQPGLAANP